MCCSDGGTCLGEVGCEEEEEEAILACVEEEMLKDSCNANLCIGESVDHLRRGGGEEE